MVKIRCLDTDFSGSGALAADVATLNSIPEAAYEGCLALAMEFVIHPQETDILTGSQDLATEHGVKAAALRNAIRTVLMVFRGAVAKQMTPEQVAADLKAMGVEEARATKARNGLSKRLTAMSATVVDQTVTVNELVDMQWKFGVTASNAEVQQVGSTFLQLKLQIDKGGELENVFTELSLPQFYDFLGEMERAGSALEELS